jgi:hypothetical protein
MLNPTSRLALGPVIVLLGVLVLGIGVGTALATTGTASVQARPGQGAVDLTRHTNVIVPGIAGSRGSLDVSCPSGTVIGGGFSGGRNLRIVESRPHGIRAWRVAWLQTSADDTMAYAYAVCLT